MGCPSVQLTWLCFICESLLSPSDQLCVLSYRILKTKACVDHMLICICAQECATQFPCSKLHELAVRCDKHGVSQHGESA